MTNTGTRPMIERILRETGLPSLLEVLGEKLPASDLQSLLLEVFGRRSALLDLGQVSRRFASSRFSQPSTVPQRTQLELDRLAYEVLPPDFEDIELSPLTPTGTCSTMGTVHPDKSIATIRNLEVCSDPTNVLALLAAARRRENLREGRAEHAVKLSTSHRVVRPEKVDLPDAWSHFRLFALTSAGRDSSPLNFGLAALLEHVRFHVDLLARARAGGYRLRRIEVQITNLGTEERNELLEEHVLTPLREARPDAGVAFAPERTRGRGYYRDVCFMVNAVGTDGTTYFLADGGLTDWTAQLLGDRKERFFISGLGTERFNACLAPQPSAR